MSSLCYKPEWSQNLNERETMLLKIYLKISGKINKKTFRGGLKVLLVWNDIRVINDRILFLGELSL